MRLENIDKSKRIIKIDLSEMHLYLKKEKSVLDILTSIIQNYRVQALAASISSQTDFDISEIEEAIAKLSKKVENVRAIVVYDGSKVAVAWVFGDESI